MPSGKPQAIAGVSSGRENVIKIEYPSVSSTAFGRALGRLYNSIPLKMAGIKLSHLLFTLPTAPLPLLWYFGLKVLGRRYVLTNRAVQVWKALGEHMLTQVPLSEIAEIVVDQRPGQVFYRAADLYLLASDGGTLLKLDGVVRAEVFRQTIIEARDAQAQVAASLATIQARRPA